VIEDAEAMAERRPAREELARHCFVDDRNPGGMRRVLGTERAAGEHRQPHRREEAWADTVEQDFTGVLRSGRNAFQGDAVGPLALIESKHRKAGGAHAVDGVDAALDLLEQVIEARVRLVATRVEVEVENEDILLVEAGIYGREIHESAKE